MSLGGDLVKRETKCEGMKQLIHVMGSRELDDYVINISNKPMIMPTFKAPEYRL